MRSVAFTLALLLVAPVTLVRAVRAATCAEVATTGTVTNGAFHHLAATYDGSVMRVYIDGNPSPNTNVVSGFTNAVAGGKIVIGNATVLNNPLDGVIDEVRIWNVARTQGQIAGSMNGEISTPATGLVGYWRFNGSGADLAAGNTMVAHSGAAYSAGEFGNGADIPSGGYFQASVPASYNVTGALTIECWVKVRSLPGLDPRIVRCIGPVEGPCPSGGVETWEMEVCNTSCATGAIVFGLQHNPEPPPPPPPPPAQSVPMGGPALGILIALVLGGSAVLRIRGMR